MSESGDSLPGMEPARWHQSEYETLRELAHEALDRGDEQEYKRLMKEAGVARRQITIDLVRQLRRDKR